MPHTLFNADGPTLKDEQEIVDRIYNAVMSQALGPSTKLNEGTLCESFGVGRMKARRALLLLASQGIVDLRSNRGAFISSPSPKEADEIFEARIHIEPSLTSQVAEQVDNVGLEMLKSHLFKEQRARSEGDRQTSIKLSGEFHVLLATVSGNKFLTRTLRELVTRTSLIVAMFGSSRDTCCREDDHDAMVQAIEKRDGPLSAQLAKRHLEHIRNGLNFSREHSKADDLVSLLKNA